MIELTLNALSLNIESDRIITFNSPNNLATGVEYTIVGTPSVRGVQHETKFLWSGVNALLTQDQLNVLNLLRSRADELRRNQSDFAITFTNTIFPLTEDPPRIRAIASGTNETNNGNGSITYFPEYYVWIENIASNILGDYRNTTFDLLELHKTTP